jgi:hypothetical protein
MPTLKEHIRNVEKALEKLKKKNKGKYFIFATPDEIERRLKGANHHPWISGWGINIITTPGGVINIHIGITNLGQHQAFNLYIHVWVGSGIVDPNGDTFLLEIDTRFPRLTEPAFSGLTVDPGSTEYLDFVMGVPTTIEKTKYCLCYCLMQLGGRETKIFDRGIVVVAVA